MDNFNYYCPTYIAFGREKENEVGSLIKRYGGSRVMIVYGGGSAVRSGLIGRVTSVLEKDNLTYTTLSGVKPNPMSDLVYKGIVQCRLEKCDFILAVGGGSVIDTAKAIAAGALYDGDFWDFFEGKAVTDAIPVGTILTIAASGSEGSADTVITREKDKCKTAADGESLRPKFSILNPELTITLPAYQTACGVADIISHILERYFTKTPHVEMTDRMSEGLLKGMIAAGYEVISHPYDYEVRANIMWGGFIAHNDVVGVGRAQDWGTHRMEHELSALFGCTHGAGLTALIPSWMKEALKEDVNRFVQLAVSVWGCKQNIDDPEATAIEGINRFQSFFESMGLPTCMGDLGVHEEDIEALLDSLFKKGNQHGRFLPVTRDVAEKIYKDALN